MRTSRIIIPILVAGAGGAVALSTGNAYALVPNYPATIEMTITNNTRHPMVLDNSDNPFGDWVVPPKAHLAPGETATVSATTWNRGGLGIDVTYRLSDDTLLSRIATATFFANNYHGSTDTLGTRMEGANPLRWNIFSSVTKGAPNMTAHFTILPPLP